MLPSFLICGGQRCGTTSLYRALAAHPVVLKAVLHKGVHYFDTSYHRGHGLVSRALPAAAHGGQGRASATACRRRPSSPARTTCTTRTRSPGSPATCPASSWSCWSATRSSGRTRSTRTSWPAASSRSATSRSALALEPARLHGQEERLADDPTYYSFAHQHHAYRARGEYATLPRGDGRRGRPGPDPRGGERAVLRRPGGGLRRGARVPRAAQPRLSRRSSGTTPGPASPRWTNGPARDLTAHFAPHDERLADWLGRPPIWRRMTATAGARRRDRRAPPRPAADRRAGAIGGVARGGLAGMLGAGVAGLRRARGHLAGGAPARPRAGRRVLRRHRRVRARRRRWRSWAPRPGWSTGRPGCAPRAAATCSAPACAPRSRRWSCCAALAVGVLLFVAAPALARLTAGDAPRRSPS